MYHVAVHALRPESSSGVSRDTISLLDEALREAGRGPGNQSDGKPRAFWPLALSYVTIIILLGAGMSIN